MKTTSMDDPEFLRYLFGKVPPDELNAAFEDYLQETNQVESFESWFNRLPLNAGLMSLLQSLYQYDQIGKQNKESLLVNLSVKKRIPKVRRPLPPITDKDIEAFSNFIAAGGLDHLNKKKNQ